MSRKVLLILGVALLVMAGGVWVANGQGGEGEKQFELVPIITTATNSVGVGTYVAAEAYAVSAGEDPAQQPVQALILPYGIHPDMLLQKIEDFVQPDPAVDGFTFEWSLAAPEGSQAQLITGTVAIFMADITGKYELSLTATDANGNSGSTIWNVYASTYIGVGGLTADAPQYPECGTCHMDKGKAWYATAHATMFSRSIDGLTSDGYGPNCVSCHTTGFDNHPEAVNGGFDDVAIDAGWVFPAELKEGNWADLVQNYPQVTAMTNIQCESCHGPGQLHVTQGQGGDDKMIGQGLDYGTCAQCHAGDSYVYPQQWETSAHANKNAEAFWYPIGEDHPACVSCHSGAGFIDAAAGTPMEEQRSEYQVITCAVCHDPHNAENPHQLRVFDSVTLPNGTEIASAGPAATCMSCHNARTDPVTSVEGASQGETFSTPHYSTAAELMNNTGGYTWGETLPSSPHGMIIQETCISCHMAPTPGTDDSGSSLPGHNQVGEHTFAMISADGVENIAVCQNCHGPVESFDLAAKADYDGNGSVETVEAELNGLMTVLQDALEAKDVKVLDSYPYFEIPDNADINIYGAIYNLKFVRGGSSSSHNFKYAAALLQLSYEKLTGEPVPDAETLR